MDQLKAYSAVAAKHWFWIATAFVTLLSLGVWWTSSGKLIQEFEAASSQLDASAQKITTVRGLLSTHPNDISHREMERLIEDRTQQVMEAWESVYSRQQHILRWPVEELQEDFVEQFRDLIPIESKVSFPTPEAEEVVPLYRTRYRDYIGRVLPSIAEIAKSKWTADFDRPRVGMGMGGMMGMGDTLPGMDSTMGAFDGGAYEGDFSGGGVSGYPGGAPREEGPLVTWSTASQEKLLTDLFPWRGSQPSTLDVLYSQENLWILRQLMQIIAEVNGDAGQRFQAKIRGINAVAIGRSVPKNAGVITKLGARGTGGGMSEFGMDGMMGEAGDGMMITSESMMSDDAGGPAGAQAAVEIDPGDNRYVDPQGTPVTASQLRSALTSNSPTDAFMAVAKRVPVMISLKMDQRGVPDLLAACGSAPLMVEVRQVRILPAGTVSNVGGMGGAGGYGGDMMPTGLDEGGGGVMSGMGGGAAPGGTVERFPLDMTVEVYGIIYIYNPPNTEALGVDKVTEDVVVDGTSLGEGRRADSSEPVLPPAAAEPDAETPEAVAPQAPAEPAVPADPDAAEEAMLDQPAEAPLDNGTVDPLPPGAVPPGAVPPGAEPPGALPPGAVPLGDELLDDEPMAIDPLAQPAVPGVADGAVRGPQAIRLDWTLESIGSGTQTIRSGGALTPQRLA